MAVEKSDIEKVDIAIAGGGLVGLFLAVLLSRELPFIEIAVIDPKSFENNNVINNDVIDQRTTALSRGSVQLLKALGLWSDITPFATAIKQVDVSDKGHLGRTVYPVDQSNALALGYVVQNHALGQSLLNHALACKNIILIPNARVVNFTPKQRGAMVRYQADKMVEMCELHAQCLVVADGATSSLRDRLGVDVSTRDYKQHAVISTLSHSKPHLGVAYERFTPQGPMALLPYGGHSNARESALVWTRPTDLYKQTLGLFETDFLAQVQNQFGYRLGVFEQVGQRYHYPLHLVLAKEQVRSSLVILGNAAHFLHPVAGQGFNLSLRDCSSLVAEFTLAHKCHKPLGSLSVLEQYQSRQANDQLATIALSDRFTALFSHNSGFVKLARNSGLLTMQKLPGVQSVFFHHMMGQGFKRVPLECERMFQRAQNLQSKRACI